MSRASWSLLLLLAPALGAQTEPEGEAAPTPAAVGLIDAPALFATNCAQCHGLDGSGTGPTVLDRPARNFKEGGFSFGNTPETIARTIAYGVPGSPMPAFELALNAAERQALADYVITLGPPATEVSEAETLLHVTDRPLVVRGILPPLQEGGPNIPRGLLIGTPDGLTFEYDTDDVRLLAVRQGDFVKRTDWTDRGGTPLEPLGRVVWSDAHGTPPQRWCLASFEKPPSDDSDHTPGVVERLSPLRARLRSTAVTDGVVRLEYDLYESDVESSPAIASVGESVRRLPLGTVSGFVRSFDVSLRTPTRSLLAMVAEDAARGATIVGMAQRTGADQRLDAPEDGLIFWYRTLAPDGSVELTGLTKLIGNGDRSFTGGQDDPPTGQGLWFASQAGEEGGLRGEIIKLVAPAWTPEIETDIGLVRDK